MQLQASRNDAGLQCNRAVSQWDKVVSEWNKAALQWYKTLCSTVMEYQRQQEP